MEDNGFNVNQIDAVLKEDNTSNMVNWCNLGLSFLEKQGQKESLIQQWVKRAQQEIKSLEDKVQERDRQILKLGSDSTGLRTQLELSTKEIDNLKTENQQLKEIVQNHEATIAAAKFKEKFDLLEKFHQQISVAERKTKTPPRSPDENQCPEKQKKLKGSWIAIEKKPSSVERKSNLSLSLTKPATKLKQTHLNFTKEPSDPDKTFCPALENVTNVTLTSPKRLPAPEMESTSPSRFSKRKVTKVLDGLKETKAPKDPIENPFEVPVQHPKGTEIKKEPESQGMNTAVVIPEQPVPMDSNESRESDVILLPTPVPEILEISDSNEGIRPSPVRQSKSLSAIPKFSQKNEPPVTTGKVPLATVNEWNPGYCRECVEYYNTILPGGFKKNSPFVLPCNHELGRRLRPDTPEGFWNPVFTPTQNQ